VANMTVSIERDDGAVVYINGIEVFRSNMPSGTITYTTLAATTIGGTDEITFYSQPVDPFVLVDANNALPVQIHQVIGTSSDIVMALELTGVAYPANQAPLANAGPDQSTAYPASVTLNGVASDDGLPIPPGLLTFGWSQISGPGTATFASSNALNTTASF